MSSKMLLLLLIYGIPTLIKANFAPVQPQYQHQQSSSSSEYRGEGHFDNYRPKFFIPRGDPKYPKDDGGQWELSYFIKNGHFPINSKLESILRRTNQLKRLKFFKSVLDGQPDASLIPDYNYNSSEKKKTTKSYPSVLLPTSGEIVSSSSEENQNQNEIENDSGSIQMTPMENQNQNHREIEKSFMRFYSKLNGKSDSDSTSAAGVINLNDLPDSSSRESDAREQFEYDEPKIFSDYHRPSKPQSQSSSIENYQSDQSQSVIRSSGPKENERDSEANERRPRQSQKGLGRMLVAPQYQSYTITNPFSSIKNLRDVRFRGLSKKEITRNIRTKSEKPVVKQTRKNNFETQGW